MAHRTSTNVTDETRHNGVSNTTSDLASAYNQVLLIEDAKKTTTFVAAKQTISCLIEASVDFVDPQGSSVGS